MYNEHLDYEQELDHTAVHYVSLLMYFSHCQTNYLTVSILVIFFLVSWTITYTSPAPPFLLHCFLNDSSIV